MQYGFTHHGVTHTPHGHPAIMSPDAVAAHNAAISADALAEWHTRPAVFAGYITEPARGSAVTLWTGERIGTVVRTSSYRNNLGARITAVTVAGSNGRTYSGRYGSDWSQLVTLRRSRHQPVEYLALAPAGSRRSSAKREG